MYICQSQSPNSSRHHPTPPPRHFPHLVSIRLFSTSVSLILPCKLVHLYHFSRFHIYALIYDTCFSLSDFLHSVWQSLGPSIETTDIKQGCRNGYMLKNRLFKNMPPPLRQITWKVFCLALVLDDNFKQKLTWKLVITGGTHWV